MMKPGVRVFIAVSLLCFATGAFLKHVQGGNHLGKPGLALKSQPLKNSKGEVVAKTVVDLPLQVLDMTSEESPITDLEFSVLPKDTTFGRRRYTAPDKFTLDLSAIMMGTDRTSIHKPQFCLDGQGWKIEKSELQSVHMTRPAEYDLPIMTLTSLKRVKTPEGRQIDLKGIYSYWFVCENRLTARHEERMWWMAQDLLLTGTLPRWAYVSCFVVCYPGHEPEAIERMQKFIQASVPEFQLPSASASRTISAPGPAKAVAALR
jgi:hypothetical protein